MPISPGELNATVEVAAVDSAIPPDEGVAKTLVEVTIPPRLDIVVLADDSRGLPWPGTASDTDGLSCWLAEPSHPVEGSGAAVELVVASGKL